MSRDFFLLFLHILPFSIYQNPCAFLSVCNRKCEDCFEGTRLICELFIKKKKTDPEIVFFSIWWNSLATEKHKQVQGYRCQAIIYIYVCSFVHGGRYCLFHGFIVQESAQALADTRWPVTLGHSYSLSLVFLACHYLSIYSEPFPPELHLSFLMIHSVLTEAF